jgi:hypothetical protein
MDLNAKLIAAVTEWDRKQSGKRGYNPYALAQYFAAVEEAMILVGKGISPAVALRSVFNDRLLDYCLKAIA